MSEKILPQNNKYSEAIGQIILNNISKNSKYSEYKKYSQVFEVNEYILNYTAFVIAPVIN